MKVIFYGTSSAVPSPNRGFACIGIHDGEDAVLLDCGDGSIHRLVRSGLDVNKVSSILLTHYHSDHVTGLTSIIETMAIRKRTANLCIYGPPGLNDYFSAVRRITNVAYNKNFQINLFEVSPKEKLTIGDYSVATFKMDHTLPCIAFRIEKGDTILSYTGDTQPCSDVLQLSETAELLIHEATFLQKDSERARQSKHSSPLEAAKAALDSRSKKLVMTHVNESYETPAEMIEEATRLFGAVRVATDGLEIEL
ncbi:MAG: MBL fold metallo-hydrolase [Nitrososphaerales archaeon]